jgi:ubiquinone biosynthesis protein UbiJ
VDPGAFVINRTLERERWARDKLAAHAGRIFRLNVGPTNVTWAIDQDGRVRESSDAPDLTLTVSPLRFPVLLAQPGRWAELVEAAGDPALATALEEISLAVPMLIEQAFARALGPIAGAFLADTGRRMLTLPDYAAQRFGESVARYAADEAELAVRGSETRAFTEDVTALSARVDALSARIDAMEASATPRKRRR